MMQLPTGAGDAKRISNPRAYLRIVPAGDRIDVLPRSSNEMLGKPTSTAAIAVRVVLLCIATAVVGVGSTFVPWHTNVDQGEKIVMIALLVCIVLTLFGRWIAFFRSLGRLPEGKRFRHNFETTYQSTRPITATVIDTLSSVNESGRVDELSVLVHGDDGSEFVVSQVGPRDKRVTPNDVPVAGDRICVWHFEDGWTLAQTTRRTAATLPRNAAMTDPARRPVKADPAARPAPMPWDDEADEPARRDTSSPPRGSATRRPASSGTTTRSRAVPAPSMSAEFERLAELHRQGILTDDEFAQAKQQVLARRRFP